MAFYGGLSRLGLRDAIAPLAVRLPGVSPSEALRAELRLNQAAQECGCNAGSQFMTAGVVLCVAYLWTTLGSPFRADLLEILSACAVVFVAAIVGKLVGLAQGRRRLLRELRVLAARAEPAGAAGGE